MKKLHMIGNTHFDPVWLWTWDEALASIRSTFRSALDRMEETPDFIYSFCTPAVFEWIEKTDPQMFGEIKQRVSEGRWDVTAEGWWLQPDCNAPTGESLIRQGLYGQGYIYRKFGRYASAVYNIDSFGHSSELPQILKKCRLEYYVFSRPDKKDFNLNDNLFIWKAKDGSEVSAYQCGGENETYCADTGMLIEKQRSNLFHSEHDLMLVYGVTNHGGAPTKKSITDITNAQKNISDMTVCFSSVKKFFSEQKKDNLTHYSGEMQPRFYGSFSDCAEIKRKNRKSEYSLMRAEAAAWISNSLIGTEYPSDSLYCCWKDVMFNQFHDILGGACIADAFSDAFNMYGRVLQNASEIINYSLQSVCREIKTFGDNSTSVWNLCVFNLTGAAFKGYSEAEVQWAWEFPWYKGPIELEDENGNTYPAQIIRARSAIPGFRSRFVFKAEIPPYGYRTYAVKQIAENNSVKKHTADEFDSPFYFRVFEDAGDVWCFNSSEGYGNPCESPTLKESKTVENGEIRTTVKQIWAFRESVFEEYITKYHENGEIEYNYKINWNEKHKVLKLLPKWNLNAEKAVCSVPCGSIERALDGREYPSGEWMLLNDVTLLFDGIFAYDSSNGNIRLTVVRSPIYGDLRTEPLDCNLDYEYMEQGIHSGKIHYIPKRLSRNAAAMRFSQWIIPPETVCEANHGGVLSPMWQGINIDGTNASVTALKQTEKKSGFVLRISEFDGKKSDFSLKLGNLQCNHMKIEPHEIKTVCFDSSGEIYETDFLEEKL